MSIINDALLKAEREKMVRQNRESFGVSKKSLFKTAGLFFVFALGVTIWIVGILNIFNFKSSSEIKTTNAESVKNPSGETFKILSVTPSSEVTATQDATLAATQSNVSPQSEDALETPVVLAESTKKQDLTFLDELKLDGILFDDKQPLAIVNKRVVREGDKVMGVKIVCIERDNIIVSNDQGEFTVKVNKG